MATQVLTWRDALTKFGEELVRFAALREHYGVDEAAQQMFINRDAAAAYESTLQQLLAVLPSTQTDATSSQARPEVAEKAPTQ